MDTPLNKMPSYSGTHQKLSKHVNLRKTEVSNPKTFIIENSILDDEDMELEQEFEFEDSLFQEEIEELYNCNTHHPPFRVKEREGAGKEKLFSPR